MCLRLEEPLDLLDAAIAEIRNFPPHLLDLMAVNPEGERSVARRVFVLLDPNCRFRKGWVRAVDGVLAEAFY